MNATLRIVRFLARCGAASRRDAADLVRAGRVMINGVVCADLSAQVDPARDVVLFDGKPLALAPRDVTLMLNKPPGVLVSRGDMRGRQTVYDLLPEEHRELASRLAYVGRLDFDTEGLLLLTTDGELVNRLTHPSHEVEKEYRVRASRELTVEEAQRFQEGVEIEGRKTQACRLTRLDRDGRPAYAVVLREGRNRQVRRMFEALGVRVLHLKRVRIGRLTLGGLPPGHWRELGPEDFRRLFGTGHAR
jgi:pseudouridine synthase